MPIPPYRRFIEPVLRYLALHPQGARIRDVYDAVATSLGLSDQDRLETYPTGWDTIYKNRARFAHDRLKRAGLSSGPQAHFWQLTTQGIAYANEHNAPLSDDEVREIDRSRATVIVPAREADASGDGGELEVRMVGASGDVADSPDDRLERALAELTASTAVDLLEAIGHASPKFFEILVLDLLHAMGYGATRADLQHVGRPGDGGIDGIISLDRLGLEKVFVQAKRWQNSVGSEDVQRFYGALAGQRATKGVLITTSAFTAQARSFAASIEKIVLIDGERLTQLMMEYGVAVTHRLTKIPKLDLDYFEE
jgi:restriction system protein